MPVCSWQPVEVAVAAGVAVAGRTVGVSEAVVKVGDTLMWGLVVEQAARKMNKGKTKKVALRAA
jgi:hypothetical protein